MDKSSEFTAQLPEGFSDILVTKEVQRFEEHDARKTQKIVDGIKAQRLVLEISPVEWARLLAAGTIKKLFTPKELGILQVAT